MKKSKFSDEQIAFALKQAESGTRVSEICRKLGICDATFLFLEEEVLWHGHGRAAAPATA